MRKILKLSLFSMLGILLLAFTAVHISYSTYKPHDKGLSIDESNLIYFQESYDSSRKSFRDEASNLVGQYEQAELFSINLPSKIDSDLTIDLLYIPPLQNTEKLLVLSSGVHGVEGYTGSAVQLMFLKELLTAEVLSEMGILMIHGVNPYGFKYLRRQTENNVDLNRGSEFDPALFLKKNPGYAAMNDMLNPVGKASTGSLNNRFFYLSTISKILKESMGVLRQAIVQGQYEYPRGIFFGGHSFEPQIDSLRMILPDYFSPYKTILAIDLHTAFGERSVLHLFPMPVEDPAIKRKTESIFKGHQIVWGDSDNFYTVSGAFADAFLNKINPDATYLYMIFEWGTFNTHTTFGSIKSLQMMINENQGFHYGYKNQKQKEKILHAIHEMEYPSSEAWRSEVMKSGRDMLGLVLKTYPDIH